MVLAQSVLNRARLGQVGEHCEGVELHTASKAKAETSANDLALGIAGGLSVGLRPQRRRERVHRKHDAAATISRAEKLSQGFSLFKTPQEDAHLDHSRGV